MPHTTHPRFGQYGVYDAHTGELRSSHDTRGQAVAAKGLDHSARVRGVPGSLTADEVRDAGFSLGFGFGRRMFGGRR